MKKLILAMLVSIFFLGYSITQANLMFNEIMYDLPDSDEGKEWVEVYNSGPESVDLSEYKFFEADTNHKLILAQGSAKIEPNSYVLIVSSGDKFKASFPNFSGTIFDSSFSLSNTGERLAIVDKDLKIIDEVVYSSGMGGAGNGRTISKIDGGWKEGKATIGAVNEVYIAPVKSVVKTAAATKPVVAPEKKSEPEVSQKISVPENNMQIASVAEAVPVPISKDKKSPVYFISMLGLIILGGGTIYLIRRKKSLTEKFEGDDFEIVE